MLTVETSEIFQFNVADVPERAAVRLDAVAGGAMGVSALSVGKHPTMANAGRRAGRNLRTFENMLAPWTDVKWSDQRCGATNAPVLLRGYRDVIERRPVLSEGLAMNQLVVLPLCCNMADETIH